MHTGTVWAFDLGKPSHSETPRRWRARRGNEVPQRSIGEAVRHGTKFLHKASLLIPADFAENKGLRLAPAPLGKMCQSCGLMSGSLSSRQVCPDPQVLI
jgi:hypothetical protein